MTYIKVKDNINLIRDIETNAIINTNTNEYENYLHIKKTEKENEDRIDNIQNDLKNLKCDIDEIKNMLKNLLA
jgi:hypothetical protein